MVFRPFAGAPDLRRIAGFGNLLDMKAGSLIINVCRVSGNGRFGASSRFRQGGLP